LTAEPVVLATAAVADPTADAVLLAADPTAEATTGAAATAWFAASAVPTAEVVAHETQPMPQPTMPISSNVV